MVLSLGTCLDILQSDVQHIHEFGFVNITKFTFWPVRIK